MKTVNVIGLIFFFGGLLAIFAWILYDLILSVDISPVIKWSIVSIFIGIIIILISLIKERSKDLKDKDL